MHIVFAIALFGVVLIGPLALRGYVDSLERDAEEKLAMPKRAAQAQPEPVLEYEDPAYLPQRKLSNPLRCPEQWISTRSDSGPWRKKCVTASTEPDKNPPDDGARQ
jgi:hypothetical protein